MPRFSVEGTEIHYISEGEGPTIVLVHGFAGNAHGNWRMSGWITELAAQGRRVLAMDCRGHGLSDKPSVPEAYGGHRLADDVLALIDHVGESQVDLMGYSMGGGISSQVLARHPTRLRSVIIAGIGDTLVGSPASRSGPGQASWSLAVADALEAEDPHAAQDPGIRGFRTFADAVKADRRALAALLRSDRRIGPGREALSQVDKPVLIVVGDRDTLVGGASRLAATISGARLEVVPGDHLSAVSHPAYKAAVREFLSLHSPTTTATRAAG